FPTLEAVRGLQDAGVRVVFDDDAHTIDGDWRQAVWYAQLAGLQPDPAAANRLDGWIAAGRPVVHAKREAAAAADAIIVASKSVQRLYAGLNAHAFLVRNAHDPADWPTPRKPKDGALRIGHVGSNSHLNDLRL